jgi:putative salt-induced outer membrane protein
MEVYLTPESLMLRWLCFVLVLLIFPVRSFCDRILLSNGDSITGTVVAWQDGNFDIKTALVGEVKAPWNAVTSITADHPLYIVLNNRSFQCNGIALEENGLRLTGPDCGDQFIEKVAIRSIRSEATERDEEKLEHANLLELWNTAFNLGVSEANSDASSTNVNVGMNAVRATANDRITVNATSIYSQTTSANNQQIKTTAVRAGARYARNLSPRSFSFGFTNFETDELQSLDLRRVIGSGLGYQVTNSPHVRFDVFSGGSFLQESFSAQPQRTAGELLFGQELAFKPRKMQFSETFTFYPNLTDRGEYRVSLDSATTVALNKWLGWHTSLSEIFITNPPLTTPGNTFLLTTGLQIKVGKERPFKPNAKVEGF